MRDFNSGTSSMNEFLEMRFHILVRSTPQTAALNCSIKPLIRDNKLLINNSLPVNYIEIVLKRWKNLTSSNKSFNFSTAHWKWGDPLQGNEFNKDRGGRGKHLIARRSSRRSGEQCHKSCRKYNSHVPMACNEGW